MATCLQVTTEGKPQLGVTNTDPFASLWGHQDDCPCASRCFPPKCAQASFAARPVGSKAPLEIPQTCMAVQQEKTQMTEVAGQSPGHSAGWDWAAGRNRRKTVAEEHAITRPTSKVDDPGVTPPPPRADPSHVPSLWTLPAGCPDPLCLSHQLPHGARGLTFLFFRARAMPETGHPGLG